MTSELTTEQENRLKDASIVIGLPWKALRDGGPAESLLDPTSALSKIVDQKLEALIKARGYIRKD